MSDQTFFQVTEMSLGALAEKTGCTLADEQTGSLVVRAASPLEDAVPGSLSFIDNPRYTKFLADTKAAAVICSQKMLAKIPSDTAALVHEAPYKAYAAALALLYPTAARPQSITGETGISPRAHVSETVNFEEDVIVEPGAIIGAGAAIGRGTMIMANAVIGQNVQIGRHCVVGPAVTCDPCLYW